MRLRLTLCAVIVMQCAAIALLTGCISSRSARSIPVVTIDPAPAYLGATGGRDYIVGIRAGNDNAAIMAQITNRLPKRVNINMSLNNGTNFSRRIAFGLPTSDVLIGTQMFENVEALYTYSMNRFDKTLLTEHGVVQVTDLEGHELARSRSGAFTIAGMYITSPATGGAVFDELTIDWTQSGAGDTVEVFYLKPDNSLTLITTLTGCTFGRNVQTKAIPFQRAGQAKLVLRSVSDPLVYAISGIITFY